MKTLAIILSISFLAALNSCSKDSGLHTGTVLQDCPAIQANQRQDAATAIKDISDKTEAAKALAKAFNITEVDAALCLK